MGSLPDSPAMILQYALVAGGLGIMQNNTNTNWQITRGKELERPENVVTIYNEDPEIFDRTMPDGEVQEYEGVNIRVRGFLDEEAWEKVNAINVFLAGLSNLVVAVGARSYLFQTFIRRTGPTFLGDLEGRAAVAYTVNGLMVVTLRD